MQPCTRGPAPTLLATHGQSVGADYAARRGADPAFEFRWPRRDGQSLYDEAHAGVSAMTDQHCAYCDGFPLDATGREEVDHFKPKSRPEFYPLVCDWTNLFLCCTACNGAKREQWDADLLRPDAPGYAFEAYFEYRFDTGELRPASTASAEAQRRAGRTIEILDLNRAGNCANRKRARRCYSRGDQEGNDFRFLPALCDRA